MSDILFIDFETRSTSDLPKQGADVYARHESTRVMAFGYAFNNEAVFMTRMGELPEPAVIDHVAAGKKVIAHNASFEWVIWNYAWRREFRELPELKAEQLDCTMARSYAMAMPGSLKNAASAVGITDGKDMDGRTVMMKLSQPKKIKDSDAIMWHDYKSCPNDWEALYAYCAKDVEVEREIYKRLLPLTPKEKIVWNLDHKINQRGVRIDQKAVTTAMKIVSEQQEKLNEEIKTITNGLVVSCNAVAQLTKWLRANGVIIDGVSKNDVANVLDDELPDVVRQVLLLRQEAAKSSTAKLKAMDISVCDDQRIRSIFQYHGASTGRWAGRRLQPQNFPRNKISQAEIEDIFKYLGKE